jgi:hypothetical protein
LFHPQPIGESKRNTAILLIGFCIIHLFHVLL